MRTLFLKIFFCFLVIIVLVGTSLETSSLLAKFYEERWQVTLHSIMPMEAEKAARMYETDGEDALRNYLDDLQIKKTARFFFFDDKGQTLLNRPAPPPVLRLAQNEETMARITEAGSVTRISTTWRRRETGNWSKWPPVPARISDFAHYLVPISEKIGAHPYLRLLVITLVAAGLCAVLTLHITRPLGKLRRAASDIAEGQLKTRVQPAIGRRHDEIALLGKDFDQMAEQIERLVTAQRNLLGDVSHELRSPLARLIVALSLLKQGQAEEAAEYQNRISIEAERLDKLIGQLLTLTRIDSGVDANLRETFDLDRTRAGGRADGDFEARAQDRAVRFLAAESCSISGVAEMIRSAVENVVRNAVRHTAPGTTVEITIERRANQTALLRVRDHGPGVPVQMLDKIFLPFHRVPVNGNGHDGGAGLGLAIADRVVKLHNGTIEAYNAREGGLVIDIHLPLKP